MGHPIHTWIY